MDRPIANKWSCADAAVSGRRDGALRPGHRGPFESLAMEINRNQYFMVGLILLFVGFQVRMVETFVLNERASRFIAERLMIGGESADNQQILPAAGPTPRRTLRPPVWLGYALVSMGAVLVLHSLAMKRPGT
jgi:hypothetical protein